MSQEPDQTGQQSPIIALKNVEFTYAIGTSPALRHLTLDIPTGQICGVIGRAGAGKSTLCALCAGFIPNFYQGRINGSARIDGQDVIRKPVAELVRHVGLVGSNPFTQISGARFTVYEEVGFGLENLGLPREEMVERIEWALQIMQLGDLRDRSPFALSGGQQQRLVLAATLAMRPPVLVLDEPTAQLDAPTTEHLAGLLRDLARQGTTILFAEHRLEWTAELAERVVALDGGRMVADGAPEAVLADRQLLDRAIGWPRPAVLAARARGRDLWPSGRPLPVTMESLIAGLRENQEPRTENQPTPSNDTLHSTPSVAAKVVARPAQANENSKLSTQNSALEAPIIQIDNIRFSYPSGVEALRGVSLTIGAGERVALLGRNGAGKSTLLRHMNGLLQPSAGSVLVAGVDTRKTSVARCARQVGIVFQDIRNQLFARTVRDELRFGPRNLGRSPAQVEALVERALVALGLTAVANEHPYDLPPALRRLVAVAAVLAMDSAVLVLDEPTAGLDTSSVSRLTTLAHDLAAQGKSVVVVSHDLDFCFEALDRVLLMQDGRLVLDSAWGRLDRATRATLAGAVGLPLALRVVQELALPPDSALAAMLEEPDGSGGTAPLGSLAI